jgi:hypothetical protein
MRGRIYLEDGAIEPWQLTGDGRFCLHEDENRWHLLTVNEQQLRGCASLKVYLPPTAFSDLGVSQSAQARCSQWGSALRKSVSLDLLLAESELLRYVEAGGWALAPELRCTTEALHIALASYALGELLGGCLGLSTATSATTPLPSCAAWEGALWSAMAGRCRPITIRPTAVRWRLCVSIHACRALNIRHWWIS